MEKYKKFVKDVKQVGDADQYGNLAYSVLFADGTSGFFKCKDQDLFQAGVESEFYMGEETGKSGKTYNKIKRVSAVENDFNKPSGTTEKKSSTGERGKDQGDMINRSVAIKAAAELLAGSSNNTPDRVLEAAEVFFDYIQFGITDKQPANVAAEMKAEPAIVATDDLPF